MEFTEIKITLKRLFNEYVKKYLKQIFVALILSLLVGASTSATAWLLDPAIKKIFIEKDRTLAWLIPLGIIIAFFTKGCSLYFARMNLIKVSAYISHFLNPQII